VITSGESIPKLSADIIRENHPDEIQGYASDYLYLKKENKQDI